VGARGGLPDTLAVAGQFRELRHAFVSDGLDDLHAFPTALTPWLDLRKKGEAGSGVSIVFPLYDEHAVWGVDTDGATLLAGLRAYAQAVGAPYYRSPGRTGLDLQQELGKRGADAKRAFPERLPTPAGQADTGKRRAGCARSRRPSGRRCTSTPTIRMRSG